MSHQKPIHFERCTDIAAALNKAVEIFTTHPENMLNDLMDDGLRPMADAAGLDRIAVYQLSNNGKPPKRIYAWIHADSVDQERKFMELPNSPVIFRWLETLTKGECINANVFDMSDDETAFLSNCGIKAILFVPIFYRGRLWGVVTLEDHTRYRYFEENVLASLRATAYLCANAFIRTDIEQKITEANEYNHVLLETVPVGFTVFDKNSKVINCNNTIINLLQTTRQYYINHFYEFSPEFQPNGDKSAEQVQKIVTRVLQGERFSFEWLHLSRSGETVPFEVTLTRVLLNQEYIVLAYQYDLRNLKKIEKMAADSNELIHAVTTASPFPYVMYDEDLHVIDCNNAIIQTLKAPDKEYLLKHYWDVLVPQYQSDGDETYAQAKTFFQETPVGKQQVYEWLHRTIDGELVPMETMLIPIIYKGQKIFIAFKYDLRRTKMLMADVQRQSELLSDALAQMTVASEAKGIFLSNMSHEMRTPLNAITGMATIGKNSADLERKDYALSKIEEASSHLLGVINDVLDMSKIEANKLELLIADFSFENSLKKAINTLYFRIEQKQQLFHLAIDGKIPHTLSGDDQRLTQVIMNLLSNAVKFTPVNGTIRLSVNLIGQEDNHSTIAIEVSDTGIGIPLEQRDRLFHAFEQADNGTARKFGGTGLGLVISKRIAQLMGGDIRIAKTSEQGSTFIFTFRMAHGSSNIAPLLAPEVNWDNMQVLAVDDDETVREYFHEIFRHLSISCETAVDGEEALALIQKNGGYDICFIDWKMPRMSGLELAKEVQKHKTKRNHKSIIIMISATEWTLIRDNAQQVKIDKYMMKPIFASDIIDCLNACLGVSGNNPNKHQRAVRPDEFKGCRILLAEDIAINREIFLTLMENTGAEIDCAENGSEVLRIVEAKPAAYDLIFMDVQMPEMDGLEATCRLRATGCTIPVIAMTANVFREDIEKCLTAGMEDHLGKPLDIEEVLKKIRKYWVHGRGRHIPPQATA